MNELIPVSIMLFNAAVWVFWLLSGKFNYGPRVRIPFDARINPGFGDRCLFFCEDIRQMGHGPKCVLPWYVVKSFRCTVNGDESRPRLWLYTRWGALFIDWRWL